MSTLLNANQPTSNKNNNEQLQSMQSIPSMSLIGKNTILLKNMHFHPQLIKISLHQPLIVKVSHNNTYRYSQITSTKKKFIFSIDELQIQTDPLQEGHDYQFSGQYFNKIGEYKLTCINIPKISSKIIVESNTPSQSSQCEDQLMLSFQQPLVYNTTKTPINLTSVEQEQPEQQLTTKQQQSHIGLSASKSDFQQYERILTQEDDKKSDSLQNKYLNYFKEQFKLWRNFFEQQELKEKTLQQHQLKLKQKQHQKQHQLNDKKTQQQQIKQKKQQHQELELKDEQQQLQNKVLSQNQKKQILPNFQTLQFQTLKNTPSLQLNKYQDILFNQSFKQPPINNYKQQKTSIKQLNFQKQQKKKQKRKSHQQQNIQTSPQPILISHSNHTKKLSLKQKHPATKNLSLSQVKQVDPNNKNKSQYEYDSDQSSSQQSKKGISIASQLYSHQEIIDRNNDYEEIHSGRKEMKKTNSQIGFNIMRSEQEKQPTLDKISVFGKQQQIHLPQHHSHSRRSNHQTTPSATNKKNNKKSYSRISMSRTQTNSPALKDYKKQNNFLTWATQWVKQKQYKPVIVQKMNDHHLIKQFNTYMKNKFKITEFMYC